MNIRVASLPNESHLMIVGSARLKSLDGETIDVMDPSTREIFATVPRAQSQDVEHAVMVAESAFAGWRELSPRDRALLMLKTADRFESHSEELARLIAKETGNAIRTAARPEAKAAAAIFRYYAGLAGEAKGETVPGDPGLLSYTNRLPLGVVAAIIPWNAPVVSACVKIASAIAVGNTIIVKAAEDAPLSVLFLGDICASVLPPGVVNILTGYGNECGAALAKNPGVKKISFTGSTNVGRSIMHAAADRLIPVSLELGGKSPSVVFPSANHDWAVDGVMTAMRFTRQSQSCTAGSRLFVHDDIYDSFLEKLAQKLAKLKIGDPLDEATDVGTLINEKQFTKVNDYIGDGMRQAGQHLLVGGPSPTTGALSKGFYTVPTLFSEAKNEWRVAREEIFGPVLVAIRWNDEQDMIRMANDTHYGLAAYLWTQNLGEALECSDRIQAGWIQVNQGTAPSIGQSFGGMKESGIGREFSLEGMLESFTQRKSVTIDFRKARSVGAR